MPNTVIIGAGPAGLIAAEIIAEAGRKVTIFDRMPSPARKFLMAGRGGLNLTHSEDIETFITRYGTATKWLAPHIQNFSPSALRAWCEKRGIETFVGSSGRVFPTEMKASPLLRAWLQHLSKLGVTFHTNHQWTGWDDNNALTFTDRAGETKTVTPAATLLALGGASWPRLGSDGTWVSILEKCGVELSPLRPSNCGFVVEWSAVFRDKAAGEPLKSIAIRHGETTVRGEAMITQQGIEGGAIYALSADIREAIAANGTTTIYIDLRPDLSPTQLTEKLTHGRGSQSRATFLRKAAGMTPVAIALVNGVLHKDKMIAQTPEEFAALIKAVPLTLTAPFSIQRAISSAGGIKREACDAHFMLKKKPGTFVAGEMLDWEAPTGGYLLQGTFSTAVAAAQGVLRWLER